MTMTRSEAGRLGRQSQAEEIERKKQLRKATYQQQPSRCLGCHHELPYEKRHNKFCSQSCAAKINNRGVARNRKEIRHCPSCGSALALSASKFCSMKCFRLATKAAGRSKLELGELQENSAIKKHLIEIRGHRCEICQNEVWMGQNIPLVLDHINGDHENRKPSNLRLICGNCDMQTPTYKNKNKGRGRHARRLRYQAEKSY